jgi:histidyl-tRNA synthetase
MGMQIILVIGPDEAAANTVTVKNLASGQQETVARADVEKVVRKILERPAG